MSFHAHAEATLEPPIEFPPSKFGNLTIIEDSTAYYLSFDFFFALPVVQLLAENNDFIEVFITKSDNDASFSYFNGAGSAVTMENDINMYFSNMLAKTATENNEQYEAYYYDKVSLMNFLSDQDISAMSNVRSTINITDGDIPRTIAVSDFSNIKRQFNFVCQSTIDEELYSFTHYIEPGNRTPTQYFREIEGMLSTPSCIIAESNFPRPFVNEHITGDTTSSNLDLIPVGSEKYPTSLWHYWSLFFHIGEAPGQRAKLPTINTELTQMRPIKIRCEIPFYKNDNPTMITGRDLLVSFLVRNNSKLKMRIKGSPDSGIIPENNYSPILEELDFFEMLASYGASLEPCKISITNFNNMYDNISVENPNKIAVEFTLQLQGWDPATFKMTTGQEWTMTIPAKTSKTVIVNSAAAFPSRYYQGYQKLALLNQINGMVSHDQNPSVHVTATVPGVAGLINPLYDNPAIMVSDSNAGFECRVVALPPWCDKICWFMKSNQKNGAGAQRHPGRSRTGWDKLGYSPTLSSVEEGIMPESVLEIPKDIVAKGNWELIADLYSKGCVKDSLQSTFSMSPKTSFGGLIDWDFTLTTDGSTDIITPSVSVSSWASSLSYSLMSAVTLPESLADEISTEEADSKLLIWFKATRFNIETGAVEEMGKIGTDVATSLPHSSVSTKTRKYVLRLFACTVGCVLPAISSSRVGSRVGSYYFNYSKVNSPSVQKSGTGWQPRYNNDDILTVLDSSYTGDSKSSTVVSLHHGGPSLINFEATYDPLRKYNLLSWKMVGGTEGPTYFIISARYGGVKAPVAWATWTGEEKYIIADYTMAGALGRVEYTIRGVFSDGTLSSPYALAAINHTTEQQLVRILGKGLK